MVHADYTVCNEYQISIISNTYGMSSALQFLYSLCVHYADVYSSYIHYADVHPLRTSELTGWRTTGPLGKPQNGAISGMDPGQNHQGFLDGWGGGLLFNKFHVT